jgi:hypothetical protein
VVSFTPRSLYPQWENPNNHWIGGWKGTRVGPGEKKKFVTLTGVEHCCSTTSVTDDKFMLIELDF